MRIILLIAAMSSLAAGGLKATPPSGPASLSRSTCPYDAANHLAQTRRHGGYRKLNQLPRGEAFAAVYRRGPDGCIVPVRFHERAVSPAPSATKKP